jgi:tetratricopeptide (TPR) repeat protein
MTSKGTTNAKTQPGTTEFENGLRLWDEGKIEEAIEEFCAAGKKGFRADAIENNIGAGYERLGQVDDAIAHYAAALKANSDNFFALKNLAELHSSKEGWADARKYFARAVQANPKDSATRLDYARCLMLLGAFAKASKEIKSLFINKADVRILLEALSILRDAEAFDAIASLEPIFPLALRESPDFLKIAGEAFLELGMTDDAIACFNKALGKASDPVTKSWLGLAEMSQGSDEHGLSLLREAMAEDDDNLQILRNLSFALHGKDRLEEALSVYERAVGLYPEEFVMWNNWGNALYNLHRYAESIPKFVTAIETNYDYEIAWNNIGNALEKMKMYGESLPYHLRAIEINFEFDYAHYAAAVALLMTGKRGEAMVELDQSLLSDPTFPEAWDLKARSLLFQAPEVAITFAQKAIDVEPDAAQPRVTMAMCQMMARMNVDAEKSLREARRIAELGGDKPALKDIMEIEEEGSAAVSRIMASNKLHPEAGSEEEPAGSDAERAFNLYKLGSEQLSKGKLRRGADLYSMAFEIDDDSSAIAYALLKSEGDKRRLKKYLDESLRISSSGLATPSLTKAIDEASHKLEYAVLDRADKGK